MQPTATPELELILPDPTQLPVSTPAAHGPAHCLNCGHAVPDRFCGQCGQDAHHTHRLTMADMLHDIPHSIWHVDKGILYTLKNMLLRPGPTIREYLAGQRKYHFPPLSLLLLVTGLYAFISSVLHIDLMPPRDPAVPEAVWQAQKSGIEFIAKYMSWVYVGLVPIIAAFARLFLRRGGYNYAECLVIAALITAVCNSLTLFFLPVSYFYSGTIYITKVGAIASLISFGYATWAYSSMLAHTGLSLAGRLIRGFLPFVLGIIVPSMLVGIVGAGLRGNAIKKEVEQQRLQKQQTKSVPAPAH
ncbi:DUF3667 domain-containing protein [Hymenobacter rubripertinctus]|uniref:DUF3667 domain-containing protein n=1 Tax=Hymenobacter rubripertinctus TaxID=2029981 RepID=A0A418R0A9_9BACT|nr:DUF3667 domain-containing protein [Hymenobacter rubripertinctus]RIY10819.1 DUF3667 domain-containing protein [Hymenobacter rubripertinctus]